MTFELLKENIAREKEVVEQIFLIQDKIDNMPKDAPERKELAKSIDLLAKQLKILNSAVPGIVSNIAFYKPLAEPKAPQPLTSISYMDIQEKEKKTATVKKEQEKEFVEKLGISQYTKAKAKSEISRDAGFNFYARISNKLFRNLADKFIEKGYFGAIKNDLRKITSPIIINSYVSMMLFSTMLAFFVGLLVGVGMIIFGAVSLGLLVILLAPIAMFVFYYFYPSSKRKTLEKEINNELPFLTIYMGAISTSGIEPSKIFDILVTSKDYPFTQRELKKLTNYVNFYGYDLVTALRMSSKSCPSDRLAQLFDGLATTITSGGELTTFLNKHADTLLFDYRLEREKYTRVAETFMNIYISIVIAAPMILMILFILMSVSGFGAGYLTTQNLGILTILIVTMLNIGFLVFLNMKQPKF